MANEVVQYPSYSQKAAYPVAHKPVEAAAVETVTNVCSEQAVAPVADIAPDNQASRFFPLVPVSVQSVANADALPEVSTPTTVEPTEVEPIGEPVTELSPFQISGSLVLEPQTNSIVITEVPDALLAGSIVTETGEILATGAIEIIAPPVTGEIEIIPDSPDADSADAIDSATEYVSSVAPIRSSGVMNSKAKIGVLPGKLRKSMEHVVLATTLAVSIITISSLLALAYMFGILR
jgi:ribonuclease E